MPGVMVITFANRVQILHEAVCVSLRAKGNWVFRLD